jgi:hypothetical protein
MQHRVSLGNIGGFIMKYQDLMDELDAMSPEAKAIVTRALDYYGDQKTILVNSEYFDILEEKSGWIESLEYLELLSDEQWWSVYKHSEGEKA